KLMWGTGILCDGLADFLAMAKHAGRGDLTEKYGPLLESVRTEMRQQLFNPAKRSFGCQGSDALALTAVIAAPEERERIVTAIVDDITRRAGRFTTGTHGWPRLLAVLSEYGQADVAYELVTREGYPGLANLLATGHGTFGETWNTWRTPYGSVGGLVQSERGAMGSWFTEWLGGIRPDPAHPHPRPRKRCQINRFSLAPTDASKPVDAKRHILIGDHRSAPRINAQGKSLLQTPFDPQLQWHWHPLP
ncbi:MAG: hypothetical protein EBT95_08440, partial [Verrucomicrobia bacterium]|nr:hypothetical protein [Verrucomicrobiota bacterium]